MNHIPDIEKKSAAKIRSFQEKKLRELISYVSQNSLYYKNLFKANSLNAGSINTIEDLSKIPVTTKDDLYKFNKDFICSGAKIIDYVTTSGTLGDPLTFALTNND